MSNETLIQMLTKALNLLDVAYKYFENYEDNRDEWYFNESCIIENRAQGILDAYEILTGKHIKCNHFGVRRELSNLS